MKPPTSCSAILGTTTLQAYWEVHRRLLCAGVQCIEAAAVDSMWRWRHSWPSERHHHSCSATTPSSSSVTHTRSSAWSRSTQHSLCRRRRRYASISHSYSSSFTALRRPAKIPAFMSICRPVSSCVYVQWFNPMQSDSRCSLNSRFLPRDAVT